MKRTYTSDDFIGAIVYYYAKCDYFKLDVSLLDEIRTKFMFLVAQDGREAFVYYAKEDALKFTDENAHLGYDGLYDKILISDDYDYNIMAYCKKHVKKFKASGDWALLKRAIVEERAIA
ncbi:MAG: hypothetical protein MJ246_05725 [Clostridia bacterium]|nr:hypothetical protein [Clostridia bacterium]